MKASRYIGLTIIIFILTNSNLHAKDFSLTIKELLDQLMDTIEYDRVRCSNSNGELVWLDIRGGATLKIQEIDNGQIHSLNIAHVHLTVDSLRGKTDNQKSIISISLSKIDSVWINHIFPKTNPYFDPIKVSNRVKLLNDSLDQFCFIDSRYSIYLNPVKSKVPIQDSIILDEGECYNMIFVDDVRVQHGVLQKITKDSIFITNSFNHNTAKREKKDYTVLRYSIKDIKALKLQTNNGVTFKKITNSQYVFEAIPFDKENTGCSSYYTWDEYTGQIYFYRFWLVERGFVPIREQDGHLSW